jgi:hypothetical protein
MIDDRLSRTIDGRPVLMGCDMLTPVDDAPEPQQEPNATGTGKTGGEKKKAAGDRFGVLNGFVDCSIPGLSRAELATWFILFRDTRNGTAATSQADIARRAGCSVKSVKNAIKKLANRGLLVVVYRGGLNRGLSRYRVFPQGK